MVSAAATGDSEAENRRRELLQPFNGVCWWCFKGSNPLCPSACHCREEPDMSDFSQRAPSHTTREGRALWSQQRQTTRTEAEQADHRAKFKVAHQQRTRALEVAAKQSSVKCCAFEGCPMDGPAIGIAGPTLEARGCRMYTRGRH